MISSLVNRPDELLPLILDLATPIQSRKQCLRDAFDPNSAIVAIEPCTFDHVVDHVRGIGLTCHRLHELLLAVSLKGRVWKVNPRKGQAYSQGSWTSTREQLETRYPPGGESDVVQAYRQHLVCSRSIVDTIRSNASSCQRLTTLGLPEELLLKILWHATVTPDPWIDVSRYVPGPDYTIDECAFDNVEFHVLNLGLTCRRFRDLLPGILFTADLCHVALPRVYHVHACYFVPNRWEWEETEHLNSGPQATVLPMCRIPCEKEIVDTAYFRGLAEHITIATEVDERYSSDASTFNSSEITEILRPFQSLKKVIVRLWREKGWPSWGLDGVVKKARDLVVRALRHGHQPLELEIWGLKGGEKDRDEKMPSKRLSHEMFQG
ncbi:hypothetical protein LTR95_007051 [Oleoguttula sp. CCFEE 5521]